MRVMIVDDDPFITESLTTILDAQPDIEVVATALGGREAVRLFSQVAPDVLLMDIRMPEGDGLSAAERILADSPQARVVFLTTFADDDYIVRALRLGARGYLIKQDVASIAPALRSVMAGQNVLGSEVMGRMPHLGARAEAPTSREAVEANAKTAGPKATGAAAPDAPAVAGDAFANVQLTEREQRIVELVAQGLDNKAIAGTVYVSEGTVRNHISSILAKLGLKNRTQIAVHYWKSLMG
ncbi:MULTISPECIES: response regulator transcription factor [unclassified Adlercreutzia]|uniref:response regulator transcription factor n=1 Tax=unclassified Adlercreutzia TaxID=2636013 RepID=UPI0013EC19F8|nr:MULTISPECIES: response regulator transcription factor [unclassified Adlercreutzia]